MNRKVPRCRWNDSAEKLQIPSSKLLRNTLRNALMSNNPKRIRSTQFFAAREEGFFHGTARPSGCRLQRSSKPQTSTRRPGWPPHRSGLGLELKIWSFFGAWCLGLGALVRAVFHRNQRRTHRKPSARDPLCKRHVVDLSSQPSVVPSV